MYHASLGYALQGREGFLARQGVERCRLVKRAWCLT